MKIEIKEMDDRITVAGILVKNGYMVRMTKEKVAGKKTNTFYIEAFEEARKEQEDVNI